MNTATQFDVSLERIANQPISEGIHNFIVADYEEGEGEKGPFWKFTAACEDEGEDKGKTAIMFMSLSQNARWRLELFFDAVGAPEKGNATADKFVGRRFRSKIEHGDYNGRPQANFAEFYPATVPNPAPAKATPQVVTKVTAKQSAPVVKASTTNVKGKQAVAKAGDELPF